MDVGKNGFVILYYVYVGIFFFFFFFFVCYDNFRYTLVKLHYSIYHRLFDCSLVFFSRINYYYFFFDWKEEMKREK
uniref:Uncharacterized protein n=1 Tax=Strigamia maritima TaxID=126957 RepID=T1JAP5_STRMM